MSVTRKKYFLRLVGRGLIVLACALLYILRRQDFGIVHGLNFFRSFSLFHLLWALWMYDMIHQLIPAKKYISLGSQKQFLSRFKPIKDKINYEALKAHIARTTKLAYWIFAIWFVAVLVLALLKLRGILGEREILLVSIGFYLCDLICVLIWCPFRLFLGNRCCTTCRIFNWDHLMMFSPLILVPGFFGYSLVLMAFVDFAVWELAVYLHPERFWDGSNEALSCSECTDKLCTQYCQGLLTRKTQG